MTEQQTKEKTEARQQAEAVALGQYLAAGKLIRLRGVQEPDLPRLAAIMSQAPLLGVKPRPLTTQSLKKEFENEKDPGLWGDRDRTYSVIAATGEVIGYVQSTQREQNIEFYCHVDDNRSDWDELGRDLVSAYKLLLTDWHDPTRIESSILEVETIKAEWLVACGLKLDVTIAESYMYQGRPVAGQLWGWVNPRVDEG